MAITIVATMIPTPIISRPVAETAGVPPRRRRARASHQCTITLPVICGCGRRAMSVSGRSSGFSLRRAMAIQGEVHLNTCLVSVDDLNGAGNNVQVAEVS